MALKQVFKTVLILFSLIIGLYALYTFSYKGGADALGISVDPSYKCRTASFLKELWGTDTTTLQKLQCQSSRPMVTVDVSLFSERECGGGPKWYNPVCSSCDDPQELFTLKSECDKCPNRVFMAERYSSGKCVLNK
ncbi:MAG: hypothetical protein IKS41_01570 [Alphaproteobacteria bacterium]|nr:hypothetical protein [Alphaproteobacteria bacterium]